MILKLTIAEANHISALLSKNEREGWYLGNREQYWARAGRIRGKLNQRLKPTEPVCEDYDPAGEGAMDADGHPQCAACGWPQLFHGLPS